MATRKQRFLKMRRRHIARREKHYSRGQTKLPGGGVVRRWGYTKLGKQSAVGLTAKSTTFGPLEPFPVPDGSREVRPAEWRVPPVPWINAWWYPLTRAEGDHQRQAIHGYHQRRVFIWKRPADRMKGLARKVWIANQIFMRHGYFPDWDHYGREPTYTQWFNGEREADESGIWPGGMEGLP